jgi:hypothetical protein
MSLLAHAVSCIKQQAPLTTYLVYQSPRCASAVPWQQAEAAARRAEEAARRKKAEAILAQQAAAKAAAPSSGLPFALRVGRVSCAGRREGLDLAHG